MTFFFLFQEYVDIPIQIRLTQQPTTKKRHMRTSVPEAPNIQIDVVQVGNVFAVKSESEDGLLVVQCTKVLDNQFNGNVLKKVSDETVHILYKLLGMPSLFLFQLKSVFSNLSKLEGGGSRGDST